MFGHGCNCEVALMTLVRPLLLRRFFSMGKKRSTTPPESFLLLPAHPTAAKAPIVDTHTHLASTFAAYRSRYKTGLYENVFDFMRGLYAGRNIEAIVDVWCEAPVQRMWKEFADSALTEEDRKMKWGGIEYWFVMGASPPTFPASSNGLMAP